MQTVSKIFKASQEIKKSIFHAYLCPFSEFKTLHETLKKAHPKAVHIVWAYRELNPYNQIVENQSDDGEPKGTSGPPSLNALRGANLINTGVFIVRYFGGIKLGTGGLVRAYSSSVNLAINEATLLEFKIKEICKFFISYSELGKAEYLLENLNLKSQKEFDALGVNITLSVTKDEFDEILNFSVSYHSKDEFYFLAVPLSYKKEI
ncbi:MAG: IMPACT family protein [Campylobacter sp.]|nr:IMPACT family protein [Campylobacter sp.]